MSAGEPSRNFERWIERHLCVSESGRTVQVFELRARDGSVDGDVWDSWHVEGGSTPGGASGLAAEIEEALDVLKQDLPTRKHSFVVIALGNDGTQQVELGRKVLTRIGMSAKSTLNTSGQDPLTAGVDAIANTVKNLLATVNSQMDQQRQLIEMQNMAIANRLKVDLEAKLRELDEVASTTHDIAMAGAKFEQLLERWGPEVIEMVGDYLKSKGT